MALITTIGGALTDSYVTWAEYSAYATAQGWTLAATVAADEANLRRAVLSVDVTYNFVGQRQYQEQAREWPRIWTGLVDGWPINPDTVPVRVKNAQMELAHAVQTGSDALPVVAGVVASQRDKAGPVETETVYQGGLGVSRFTAVDRLLEPYTLGGIGTVRVMRG